MATTRRRYANDTGANSFFVALVTSGFPLNQNDRYVILQIESSDDFYLPASPVAGQRHTFVDDTAGLSTSVIATVQGNGKNINGSSTYPIFLSRRSVTFQYNGTQWNVLESAGRFTIGEGAATSNQIAWPLMHGVVSTPVGVGTPQIIGSNYYDPIVAIARKSEPGLTVNVKLKVILATTNASNAAYVDLIDVNNVLGNGAGAAVPGSSLTTTSTSQTFLSANLASLTTSLTAGIFSARLWIDPTAVGEQAICYMAKIEVVYT